ncbi:hypothetical protein [Terrabacter sp. Root181]|uniref:channel accessory protein ArfC n=1 Tax=Terrabacter sp. Root181 TaxID=1736484 RepID=UPI0006FDF3F0|nr:hypothetical protein [Terrabacter sp. Root181]KRB44087.1 hypothetical protein ASD90_16795 [Terrabacter sp. Root181]
MKWLLLVLAFVLGAAVTWFLTVRRASRTVQAGPGAGASPAAAASEQDVGAVEADAEPAGPELTPLVSPGEPVAGAVGIAGGADLTAAAGAGALAAETAEAAPDAGSQDEADDVDAAAGADVDEAEDADGTGFGGAHTPLSEPRGAAESWDRDAQDEDALLTEASTEPDDSAPVVDATPNGDVAGVGEPVVVAALDEAVEADDAASWTDAVPDLEPSPKADLDADVSVEPADDVVPIADATPSGDVAGVGGSRARPTQGELTFDEPQESVPPEDQP